MKWAINRKTGNDRALHDPMDRNHVPSATWDPSRESPEDWNWGSARSALLEIADHSEGLALFFLVAATPTSQSFNDAEAEEFQKQAYKGFAALSAHILERDLANDMFDSWRDLLKGLREWAVKHGHGNLVAASRIPKG